MKSSLKHASFLFSSVRSVSSSSISAFPRVPRKSAFKPVEMNDMDVNIKNPSSNSQTNTQTINVDEYLSSPVSNRIQHDQDLLKSLKIDEETKELKENPNDDWYVEDVKTPIVEPLWMKNLARAQQRAEGILEEDFKFDPENLLDSILHRLTTLRPLDVVVLNVQNKCDWCSQMIIIEGRSPRHLYTMAADLRSQLKHVLPHPVDGNAITAQDFLIEGMSHRTPTALRRAKKRQARGTKTHLAPSTDPGEEDWLILDAGNIVLNFMMPDARKKYDLEGLWQGDGLNRVEQVIDSLDQDQEYDVAAWKRMRK